MSTAHTSVLKAEKKRVVYQLAILSAAILSAAILSSGFTGIELFVVVQIFRSFLATELTTLLTTTLLATLLLTYLTTTSR